MNASDWVITPNFFNYVDKSVFDGIRRKHKKQAFQKAGAYISKQMTIVTQEEEYQHFYKYYEILFNQLPQLKLSQEQIEQIARDLVYNEQKYVFYKDVQPFLESAKTNYKLAIVSDAWPSLENVYQHAGLRKYFQSFIISSQLGTCKPNPLMYNKALEALGIQAHEAIFVDDSKRNCEGAKNHGIETVLICRSWPSYQFNRIFCRNHKVINNLNQINLP